MTGSGSMDKHTFGVLARISYMDGCGGVNMAKTWLHPQQIYMTNG